MNKLLYLYFVIIFTIVLLSALSKPVQNTYQTWIGKDEVVDISSQDCETIREYFSKYKIEYDEIELTMLGCLEL